MNWKKFLFPAALVVFGFFIYQNKGAWNSTGNNRFPSSSQELGHELAHVIKELNKIQSPLEVSETLYRLQSEAQNSKKTPEQTLVLEAIEVILAHKGFINRLRPLIESNELTSLSVTAALKGIKQNIPEEAQWLHHLYDSLFLINPQMEPIQSIDQLQNHFVSQVVPRTKKMIELLDNLEKKNKDNYIVGNLNLTEIFPGKFNHLPSSMQEVQVSLAHLKGAKAALQAFLGYGYYLASYDLNQLPDFANQVFSHSLKRTVFSNFVKSFSVEKSNSLLISGHAQALKEKSYQNFLTLKQNQYLADSQKSMVDSAKTILELHDLLQENQESVLFSSHFGRIKNLDRKKIEAEINFLSGTATQEVMHPVTGDLISVNPQAIWNAQQSDLKNYFPTAYAQEKTKTVGNQKIVDLNYGNAIAWNDPTFGGVLPQGSNENLDTLTRGLSLNPTSSFVGAWLRIFQ